MQSCIKHVFTVTCVLFSPFGLVIFDVGPRADGFTMDFSLMLGEKIFGRLAMCFVDVG